MLYPITKHEQKSSIRHIRNEGYVWSKKHEKKRKKFVEEPKVVISLIRHIKHDTPFWSAFFEKSLKKVSIHGFIREKTGMDLQ